MSARLQLAREVSAKPPYVKLVRSLREESLQTPNEPSSHLGVPVGCCSSHSVSPLALTLVLSSITIVITNHHRSGRLLVFSLPSQPLPFIGCGAISNRIFQVGIAGLRTGPTPIFSYKFSKQRWRQSGLSSASSELQHKHRINCLHWQSFIIRDHGGSATRTKRSSSSTTNSCGTSLRNTGDEWICRMRLSVDL